MQLLLWPSPVVHPSASVVVMAQEWTTYSLTEVAAELCGDSMLHPTRWLAAKIKAGEFPARKIGRQWRMTRSDVDAALEALANGPKVQAKLDSDSNLFDGGLSAGSRRRLLSARS